MTRHTTPLLHAHESRLGYADTDPAGILYFASWFPKMERLQTEFFFREGLRQDKLHSERGWQTITRATECEYLVPASLYDLIRCELRIGRIGTTSFSFEYTMLRPSDDALVARASITLVTISTDHTVIRIPPDLTEILRRWATEGARDNAEQHGH